MKMKTVKRRAAGGAARNGAATSANGNLSSLAGVDVGRPVKRSAPRRDRAPRQPAQLWQLRLYVTGQTPKSLAAFSNLKLMCESRLKGHYRITVVDLVKQPQLAKGDQILAIPTVVRKLPKPVRTIIGNLSDTDHMLVGLDLRAAN
jgi:circadian clock protein KaiB